MKLINSKVEILEPTGYTIDDIYKQIEIAGRTCYKSEDKITPTSAKEFVDRMIKSGHGAMLEHGTVYLKLEGINKSWEYYHAQKYLENNYSKVVTEREGIDSADWCEFYITTNFRVLVENNWLDDLKYICEPTEFHEKRISVRWTCDRGVSHEYVRHRVFSFAQESTRYCNYSKEKFGSELTFIEPCWLENYDYEGNTYYNGFLVALKAAEANYFALMKKWEDKIPDKRYKTGFRNNPWTPQQARAVLPNALKTELVMTGFESDWKHFFELRCDTAAHPDARKLALELYNKLYNKEYGKE